MPEPRRYVIQKIGDKYVPVAVHQTDGIDAWVYRVGGGVMTLCGVGRGGLRGWIGALVGAALLYRGFAGKSLASYFFAPTTSKVRDGDPRLTPSYQNDAARRSTMLPADQVDEMVMKSFPASDPPARHAAAKS